MQDQLKEYGLNLAQAVILLALLIMPQVLGNYLIASLGLTETKPYFSIFIMIVGFVAVYYGLMIMFHQKLINRIDTMILFKYFAVIGLIFWAIADAYFSFKYQQAYFLQDETIIRRDIVWRDVAFADLPEYVIYPNFRFGFLACLMAMRAVLVAVLVYGLMNETKTTTKSGKVMQRRKLRSKSAEELKATLHPSILKRYQDDKKSE